MASPEDCFGNICRRGTGPHPWVTLFSEIPNGEGFQPVDDDTIMIFCKLYEPDWNAVEYLGYLLPQKTELLADLMIRIRDAYKFPGAMHCQFYIEIGGQKIKEITEIKASLAEVLLLGF